MDTKARCRILELPPEIVFQIISDVPFSSHLDLALSCSSLHRHAGLILECHRVAHAKYEISSDLSPTNAIQLLYSSSNGGLEAWHVRELEIWGSRTSGGEWRVARELGPAPPLTEVADEEAVETIRGAQEKQSYFEMARQWWDIPDDEFNAARAELDSGEDGFLKALLIASCPRLRSLRFVKRGPDDQTSLVWMARAIAWSISSGRWPPGFQSLRNVAVGVSPGLGVLDIQPTTRAALAFAAILNLPCIRSVYISELDDLLVVNDDSGDQVDEFDDDLWEILSEPPRINYDLAPPSSSVEHIFLDRVHRLESRFRKYLLEGPKALVSMTIRGEPGELPARIDGMEIFAHHLSRNYSETLLKFTLYNTAGLHGGKWDVYPPGNLETSGAIKLLTIGIPDVELQAYRAQPTTKPPNRAEFTKWLQGDIFPRRMEGILFWGASDEWLTVDEGLEQTDILDHALATLIRSRRYEYLKVIYVDRVESETNKQRTKLCFQEAIAAGREAGVHVHTLTNRDDGGYWREFPAAPDKFDLKTGPYRRDRSDFWVVNRFTGEWESPGCRGCGECRKCLRVYPREIWESVGGE